MAGSLISNWSKTETNKLLSLKAESPNMSPRQIADKLNALFYNNRTPGSVSKKLYSMKKILYNEKMDTIIIKHIREYPTNLQYAFGKAAEELNSLYHHQLTTKLTKQSISGRYYAVIKHKYNVISTGSTEGFSVNVKNSYVLKNKKGPSKPKQHLKPVLWLMKEILTLNDTDRQQLIDFLNNTN